MSKTETAKNLRDSRTETQLEILKSIRDLRLELKSLPEALAKELSERLEPLEQITKAQRRTLDEAMRETSESLAAIRNEELPARLNQAAQSVEKSARQLERPKALQQVALMTGAGLLAGLLVVLGTAISSEILPQSGAAQANEQVERDAETMRVLWARATPEERELLRQIVNRRE